MAPSKSSGFRVACIQMSVVNDKAKNLAVAVARIEQAKQNGCTLAILPECFNGLYEIDLFRKNAEVIPSGETCKALSQAAKSNQIYVVGGSIPELYNDKVYNTCTVWDPNGKLIATHRKVHLFEVNIPGKTCYREANGMTPGNTLNTFQLDRFKVGLGICHDIRFPEMAELYRKQECDMLIYPGNFCMNLGPLHWSLLTRSRALDTQTFVAFVSSARVPHPTYITYGHSQIANPWGEVIGEAGEKDTDLYVDLDFSVRENMRQQVPTEKQKRNDIYDVILKKN